MSQVVFCCQSVYYLGNLGFLSNSKMLPRYKYLITYRFTEIVQDLTVLFCERFLFGFDFRRTREQMIQAARSGKQNIIEGVGQGERTSKKGEIKLLGVAAASLEELIADFEDFLRQRDLAIWFKNDPRIVKFRQQIYFFTNQSNLGLQGNLIKRPALSENPGEAANFWLTLCHQATFLLDKQIEALEKKFIQEGGYSENLFKKRLDFKNQK